jgi:hypothetical protein
MAATGPSSHALGGPGLAQCQATECSRSDVAKGRGIQYGTGQVGALGVHPHQALGLVLVLGLALAPPDNSSRTPSRNEYSAVGLSSICQSC